MSREKEEEGIPCFTAPMLFWGILTPSLMSILAWCIGMTRMRWENGCRMGWNMEKVLWMMTEDVCTSFSLGFLFFSAVTDDFK